MFNSIYDGQTAPSSFHPHHYIPQPQDRSADEFYLSTNQLRIRRAWETAIDESVWRIGLTINQGNKQNVSDDRVIERLRFIRKHLVRKLFGKGKGWIRFMIFRQGSAAGGNQHFHILMQVFGQHDWSDFRLTQEIRKFDLLGKRPQEKIVYTNHDLHSGNRFHSYCAREAYRRGDEWGFLL